MRIGYRLVETSSADVTLSKAPWTSEQLTLTASDESWHYNQVTNIPLNSGNNTIIITASDPVDIDYLSVRGEGQQITSAGESGDIPDAFHLEQNYPNPFNPVTVIRYDLPVENHVQIAVYDLLGRKVSVLVDDHKAAGSHETLFDATRLSSGIYLYRITSGDFEQTRQMMLVK